MLVASRRSRWRFAAAAHLGAARRSRSEQRCDSDGDSDADPAAGPKRRAGLSRAASGTERRADHRRHAAAVRRHLAAGRDCDGALKNPNLAISASNFRIARYNIVQVKGAYDVALHLQPQSNFSVNPPQNFLAAGPGEIGGTLPGVPSHDRPRQHHPAPIRRLQYGLSGQTENGTSYQAGIQQSSHL